VLAKILPYKCISVQNEGISAFVPEVVERLQQKETIIMYDADDSGVKNCKKICDTHQFRYVNTPRHLLQEGVKDPSDWVKRQEGIKS
jgi:DNA primase